MFDFRRFKHRLCLTTCLSSLFALPLANAAEQQWWFDVEVMIFKHEQRDNALSEKFVATELQSASPQSLDLLSPYLLPDLSYLRANLDYCRASNRAKVAAQYEQDFAFPPAAVEEELPATENAQAVEDSQATAQQPSEDGDFEYTVVNKTVFAQPDQQQTEVAELSNEQPEFSDQADALSEQDVLVSAQHAPADLTVNWVEWQIPAQLPCVYAEQLELLPNPFGPRWQDASMANIAYVPSQINGIDWQRKGQAFLLPTQQFRLRSLYNKLNKQANLQGLLYLSWRQEVKFGQDKAQSVRLFAGKNYANEFYANGRRKPQSVENNDIAPDAGLTETELDLDHSPSEQMQNAELFAAIQQALNDDSPVELDFWSASQVNEALDSQTESQPELDEIWQLDGDFKVFLKYVGRTPYLHITSKLNYRQPIYDASLALPLPQAEQAVLLGGTQQQANLLQNIQVSQFKQVISKQLHYFDHPLFGMAVYISRHHWPDDSDQSE